MPCWAAILGQCWRRPTRPQLQRLCSDGNFILCSLTRIPPGPLAHSIFLTSLLGLNLNRIHQESEHEANSPSWKRTPALAKVRSGGRQRCQPKDVSCWRQLPPSSSKLLHIPSSGSLLNGRAFPGARKLGQGIVVQQEMG